jgi:Mrp family chromosome partitioning ATPase
MSDAVSVVIGAAGAPWELRLLHELGRGAFGVRIARRCSEVGELIGVTRRDRPDVVLLDGTSPWLDREVVTTVRRSGASVVALGGDGARWAELVRVLPVDADVDTVVRALVEAHAERAVTARDGDERETSAWGRIVAVWSGAGAPGRTTVAVHLAAAAARAGTRVLLIDGDAWGASVAQLLDLAEAPSVVQAARSAAAGWPEPLAGFLQAGPDGVSVLAGLPHPDLWAEVTETAWRAVLTEAASTFDLVVVDLAVAGEEDEELVIDQIPVRRNVMTTVTLEQADDVVLVVAADPVGLRRGILAHRRLLESPDPRGDTVRVVLNRVPRPGRRRQDCSHVIGEWTGAPPVALLPDEPLLARVVWEGRPLRSVAPRSRWLRELAPVLAAVVA